MSELEFSIEIEVGGVEDVYFVYGRKYTSEILAPLIPQSLVYETIPKGDRIEPFMKLTHYEAMLLMDQLYACGIRPSGDIKDEVYDEVGFLKEILRRQDIHLADIRSVLELRDESSLNAPKIGELYSDLMK
ncbi:MAG: hypothetical protein GY941_15855 [Planctomycetes bacterium]|nr:hypothetical protein [Planctomycetota bacterium]